MGMLSEIMAEDDVLAYCKEIQRLLQTEQDPGAVRAFKQIGRFALTRFDWTAPEWAKEYEEMFRV